MLAADAPAGPSDWVDRFGNEPRKGCDILVQCLEREGVETVFAYPGEQPAVASQTGQQQTWGSGFA